MHLPKFNQNGSSIQQLQSSSKIQWIGPGGFLRISNLSNLKPSCCFLWSFRQSASPSMPKFSIYELCKSCDDFVSLTWNFNMLTTSCHHYSLIIFYWSLIEDYSVLVAFTSEFYFAYCGVLFFENSVVSKRAHFQRNCIII